MLTRGLSPCEHRLCLTERYLIPYEIGKDDKPNLLLLGKKETSFFVLRSPFRNFGFAELTWHSEMKRRVNFSFAFLSFFRNFGRNLKLSLFIGGLRDNAIFEVTNWKPSYFRILPRYAYC